MDPDPLFSYAFIQTKSRKSPLVLNTARQSELCFKNCQVGLTLYININHESNSQKILYKSIIMFTWKKQMKDSSLYHHIMCFTSKVLLK